MGVAFRNPPFHPDPTIPLLLRILGLPQTLKSRLSSVTGPSKDLPPTWPLTFPVLSVPVLGPGRHGGVGKRARGRRSGVVSGELGSRQGSISHWLRCFLSVSVVTDLGKFPKCKEKKGFVGQTG